METLIGTVIQRKHQILIARCDELGEIGAIIDNCTVIARYDELDLDAREWHEMISYQYP